jgi:Circularly permutated YpsA SLOG family
VSKGAEDGPIGAKYPLKESLSASYLQRNEWNVRDSDATVLFSLASELTGGSKKTARVREEASQALDSSDGWRSGRRFRGSKIGWHNTRLIS